MDHQENGHEFCDVITKLDWNVVNFPSHHAFSPGIINQLKQPINLSSRHAIKALDLFKVAKNSRNSSLTRKLIIQVCVSIIKWFKFWFCDPCLRNYRLKYLLLLVESQFLLSLCLN